MSDKQIHKHRRLKCGIQPPVTVEVMSRFQGHFPLRAKPRKKGGLTQYDYVGLSPTEDFDTLDCPEEMVSWPIRFWGNEFKNWVLDHFNTPSAWGKTKPMLELGAHQRVETIGDSFILAIAQSKHPGSVDVGVHLMRRVYINPYLMVSMAPDQREYAPFHSTFFYPDHQRSRTVEAWNERARKDNRDLVAQVLVHLTRHHQASNQRLAEGAGLFPNVEPFTPEAAFLIQGTKPQGLRVTVRWVTKLEAGPPQVHCEGSGALPERRWVPV